MKLIVFDTNAWLDLYMIHPLALEEIIDKFYKKRDIFWIPEQVYWEYDNHLSQKREDALGAINKTSSIIRESIESTKATSRKYLIYLKNNSIISDEKLIKDIESKLDTLRKDVKHELECLDKDFQKRMTIIADPNDIVHNLIDSIYEENPPYIYTAVQRIALYEEGEKRVKYHIPPGLTDCDKEDSDQTKVYRRRYGDFLIWKDILRKTEEIKSLLKKGETLHVIFVQNERKGDWWISRGKPVIAPTLEEEFGYIAGGRARIEMLSFDDFISNYSKDFGINEQTINDLVAKNKYKERVIEEIKKTKTSIIKKGLLRFYHSLNRFEDLFKWKSYFGGTFDNVTDFKLNDIKCDDTEVIDERALKLVGEIEYEYSGKLTETVGNEKKLDTVNDSNKAEIAIEISIDYSQGYEECHYDIGSVYVNYDYNFYSEAINRRLSIAKKKKIIFKRDNYTCQMCGRTFADGAFLSIDHIIPLRHGGSDDLSNLQTLCRRCNAMKADKIIQPISTCPDCGRNIYYWNDGGNGFCSDCAKNH